jgi:hypothetical protein
VVVGRLLGVPQGNRRNRTEIGELVGSDARSRPRAQDVAHSGAIAELLLAAPEQLAGQPALERLPQQMFGDPVARRAPLRGQAERESHEIEIRDLGLEAVGHRHVVCAPQVQPVQVVDQMALLGVQGRWVECRQVAVAGKAPVGALSGEHDLDAPCRLGGEEVGGAEQADGEALQWPGEEAGDGGDERRVQPTRAEDTHRHVGHQPAAHGRDEVSA